MLKKISALIVFLFICLQPASGAFNMINSSARALGMGNAFVAVADDITSILDNPAGLANLSSLEATFTGSKVAWGIDSIDESFTALGYSVKGLGAVGVGYYSFTHSLYAENSIFLALAVPVPLFKKSSISVSGKYLTKNYTSNEWTSANPDFTALSKNNISIGASFY
ncbi:MAG: hypothetical protein WCK36_01600, partial [Candidatus Firestonebacteria bacterium]